MHKCLAWPCKEEVETLAEDQICPFWKSKGVDDLFCYTRILVALRPQLLAGGPLGLLIRASWLCPLRLFAAQAMWPPQISLRYPPETHEIPIKGIDQNGLWMAMWFDLISCYHQRHIVQLVERIKVVIIGRIWFDKLWLLTWYKSCDYWQE